MDKTTTENSKLTREDIEGRGWVINEELQNEENDYRSPSDKERLFFKKRYYSGRYGLFCAMYLLFVPSEAWCLIYSTHGSSIYQDRHETRFAGRVKDASIFDIITDAIGMNDPAPEHQLAVPTVETPDQCYKP